MKEINCPVRQALDIIGGKWTLYIIHQIGSGTIRYGELKRKVDGISEKMFVNELKALVNNGIVNKNLIPKFRHEWNIPLPILEKNCYPL